MEKKIAAIVLVTTLVIALLPCTALGDNVENLKSKLIEVYVDVALLGKEGINVSRLVHELNIALKLISRGDEVSLIKAKHIILHVEEEVKNLRINAKHMIFLSNLSKYSIVAVLISIPFLFYFLVPRLYLRIWFKVRRKWVVEQ